MSQIDPIVAALEELDLTWDDLFEDLPKREPTPEEVQEMRVQDMEFFDTLPPHIREIVREENLWFFIHDLAGALAQHDWNYAATKRWLENHIRANKMKKGNIFTQEEARRRA